MKPSLRLVSFACAAAAGVAAVAVPLAAQAGGRSPYSVSLALSHASTAKGGTVTLAGKVSGSGASGHAVTIERKDGSTWKKVSTATVASSGKFTKKVTLTRGGSTSFRVVKAASSAHTQGVSTARTLSAVYAWVPLATQSIVQPRAGVTADRTATVDGKTYPHTVTFAIDGDVTFSLGNACTKLRTGVGLDDGSSIGTSVGFIAMTEDSPSLITEGGQVEGAAVTPFTVSLKDASSLTFRVTGGATQDDKSMKADFTTPEAYCNLAALPKAALPSGLH